MATLTASLAQANIPAKVLHEGANVVWSTHDTAATPGGITVTAGSVFYMCKIPHGATVTDCVLRWHTSGNFDVAFGTSDDPDRFFLTASGSGVMRAAIGIPFTVSVSDDAQIRFVYATVLLGSGEALSATHSFTMVCTYTMDH